MINVSVNAVRQILVYIATIIAAIADGLTCQHRKKIHAVSAQVLEKIISPDAAAKV